MCRRGNLLSSKSENNVAYAAFFCLLLSSLYGSLAGQLRAGRTLGTVFPPLLSCHQILYVEIEMVVCSIDQEHTTMNIKFHDAISCTPKRLAKQLMIDGAKLLNQQQRQALLDIYLTLDLAEQALHNKIEDNFLEECQHSNSITNSQNDHEFIGEYNQEYWSGQHCDSYNQDYPEDWLRRTQQRPQRSFAHKTY